MKTYAPLFLVMALSPLFAGTPAVAQSAYFQAITNLNPAGYWPMHEIEGVAQGDIETNYGSLGELGTGYYPDWAGGDPLIVKGAQGAIAFDSDTAVSFEASSATDGGLTNALYLPHTSPLTTLTPPFSVECWFNGSSRSQGADVWSQSGYEGLNAGAAGNGNGNVDGIRLYWNAPGFTVYLYANSSTLQSVSATGTYVAGQWYHVVVTDDGNSINLYVNGVSVTNQWLPATLYFPDYWTPFEIGNGRGNTRAISGSVDEVAVYTNVLPDIAAHYAAGIKPSPGTNYFHLVLNDHPLIYYRMDAHPYTEPNAGTWPALINNGYAGANGVYSPGAIPGAVPGPASIAGLSGQPVAQFSGVASYGDAGYSDAWNPTGTRPFTVTAMFRANPTDNRTQTIVGHSSNSWRVWLNTSGRLCCQLGTNTDSAISSANVYNDGNWHQAAMVYTPASEPNVTGTNALYVDGVLDTELGTVSTNGIGPGSTSDVMIAGDPQYLNNPPGLGQQFAGQVCEVALFTNALTVGQIQDLYSAAGVVPAETAPTGGDAIINPQMRGQLITTWGYDIKEGGKAGGVTPSYALTLFVTNKMNCLRLPIYGDEADPAHPSPGVVIGSYYTDVLFAMTNARDANSNVILFASKKLDGMNSFPPWTTNGSGVIPAQYASMLADYLQFMQTNGFTIDVLGVDNESQYNEGNITASSFASIIQNLNALSGSRGFPMPKLLIAPENYSPDDSWMRDLLQGAWGNLLGIVGTHYYPQNRPFGALQTLVKLGGNLPDWHSEIHWNNLDDAIDSAQEDIPTIFDCTDTGLSGFVWWAYDNTGIQGGMEQALTANLINTRPVFMNDIDGTSTTISGQLITRAFASSTNLVVWAINDNTNVYTNYGFRLLSGSITGPVNYIQWTAGGSTNGFACVTNPSIFRLTLPARTVTQFLAPFNSNVALSSTHAGNNIIISWPYPSIGFVLQQSSNLISPNWTNSCFPVSTDAVSNYITIQPQAGNLFFRLLCP